MSLPLVFRPAARFGFDEAAAWYEERQPGLGEDFVTAIDQVLTVLAEQPKRYPLVEEDVREAPAPRFPYCVYYRATADRIVVLAVFHSARDPAIWRGRT